MFGRCLNHMETIPVHFAKFESYPHFSDMSYFHTKSPDNFHKGTNAPSTCAPVDNQDHLPHLLCFFPSEPSIAILSRRDWHGIKRFHHLHSKAPIAFHQQWFKRKHGNLRGPTPPPMPGFPQLKYGPLRPN